MQLLWKEAALAGTYSCCFMRKTGKGILLCAGGVFPFQAPILIHMVCSSPLFTHFVLHPHVHTHTLTFPLPIFPTTAALERLEEVMVYQFSVSCMGQSPLDCHPRLRHTQPLLSKVSGWYPWSAQEDGMDWDMVLALGLGSAGQDHTWLRQFLLRVTCEGSVFTDRCPSPAPGGAALLSTGHCSAAWDCPGFQGNSNLQLPA